MLQYIDRPQVTSENSTPTPTQTLKYRGVTYSPEPDHNLAQPSDVIDWELSQPLIYRGIPRCCWLNRSSLSSARNPDALLSRCSLCQFVVDLLPSICFGLTLLQPYFLNLSLENKESTDYEHHSGKINGETPLLVCD